MKIDWFCDRPAHY